MKTHFKNDQEIIILVDIISEIRHITEVKKENGCDHK